MSETLRTIELEWGQREVPNGEVITRVWQVQRGATTQSLGQERGDYAYEDKAKSVAGKYEILSSRTGHVEGKAQVRLYVTAFRSDLWPGVGRGDTFRELLNSRKLKRSENRNLYQRQWECDSSDIQEGENGWGAVVASASVVTQADLAPAASTTMTWVSGSLFYPAMVGLPMDYATSTDTVAVTYVSPTSLIVSVDQETTTEAITFRGPLPAEIGDAYGAGTWTNRIEPSCIDITINPSWTIQRSLITATYSAARIL